MKVLIISDSHGRAKRLNEIVDRVKADHVIHCGDFCTGRSELPSVPLTVVRGNCDWEEVSEEEIFEADSLCFFVAHGHLYRVKESLLPIKYRAQEAGAQIACFGHSHFPVCEKEDGVLLINPGSITQPRGFTVPTYAVLETKDGKIKVVFYQIDGTPITERGFEGELS